jgi:hypothetical protein
MEEQIKDDLLNVKTLHKLVRDLTAELVKVKNASERDLARMEKALTNEIEKAKKDLTKAQASEQKAIVLAREAKQSALDKTREIASLRMSMTREKNRIAEMEAKYNEMKELLTKAQSQPQPVAAAPVVAEATPAAAVQTSSMTEVVQLVNQLQQQNNMQMQSFFHIMRAAMQPAAQQALAQPVAVAPAPAPVAIVQQNIPAPAPVAVAQPVEPVAAQFIQPANVVQPSQPAQDAPTLIAQPPAHNNQPRPVVNQTPLRVIPVPVQFQPTQAVAPVAIMEQPVETTSVYAKDNYTSPAEVSIDMLASSLEQAIEERYCASLTQQVNLEPISELTEADFEPHVEPEAYTQPVNDYVEPGFDTHTDSESSLNVEPVCEYIEPGCDVHTESESSLEETLQIMNILTGVEPMAPTAPVSELETEPSVATTVIAPVAVSAEVEPISSADQDYMEVVFNEALARLCAMTAKLEEEEVSTLARK